MTSQQTIIDSTKKGDLIQVNLAEVKEQVGDQIRAFLLNMLPKEVFDRVIQDAWDNLTKPRVAEKDRWGNITGENKPSELEEMVTNQMRQIMLDRVKTWGEQWSKRAAGDIDDVLTLRLNALATECAKVHLQSVGDSILSRAFEVIGSSKSCGGCGRMGRPGTHCHGCGNQIPWQ